eukprot:12112467-Alexandrium_andersonii.AAC.1
MYILRWSLEHLVSGTRPTLRHDSTAFPEDNFFKGLATSTPDLGFTAIVLWIKGDMAEWSHSLGLASCASKHCPCAFCATTMADAHGDAHALSLTHLPWDLYTHEDYEE